MWGRRLSRTSAFSWSACSCWVTRLSAWVRSRANSPRVNRITIPRMTPSATTSKMPKPMSSISSRHNGHGVSIHPRKTLADGKARRINLDVPLRQGAQHRRMAVEHRHLARHPRQDHVRRGPAEEPSVAGKQLHAQHPAHSPGTLVRDWMKVVRSSGFTSQPPIFVALIFRARMSCRTRSSVKPMLRATSPTVSHCQCGRPLVWLNPLDSCMKGRVVAHGTARYFLLSHSRAQKTPPVLGWALPWCCRQPSYPPAKVRWRGGPLALRPILSNSLP